MQKHLRLGHQLRRHGRKVLEVVAWVGLEVGVRLVEAESPLAGGVVLDHVEHLHGDIQGGFDGVVFAGEKRVVRVDGGVKDEAEFPCGVEDPLERPEGETLHVVTTADIVVVAEEPGFKVAAVRAGVGFPEVGGEECA